MPEDEFGKYFYKYFKNQIELDYRTWAGGKQLYEL